LVLVADRDGVLVAGVVGVVVAEVVSVPVVGPVVAGVVLVGGIASVVACDGLAGCVGVGAAVAPRATAPASNDPAGAAIAAVATRIVRRLRARAEQDPEARRIRCESQSHG
jgi:hypothetical protein